MYIYRITNPINDKVYIGQTVRPFRHRLNEYRKKGGNDYLTNAFNKYGFENFIFELVCEADSIEQLNELEIAYIQEYDSCNRDKGYNIEAGGRNSVPSEETRQKMSLSRLGKIQTEEWIGNRISKAGSDEAKKYGRVKSEEERKVISEKGKMAMSKFAGIARDEETKRKISEKKKGVPMSDIQRKNFLASYARKVEMIDLKSNVIIYESQKEAALAVGVSLPTIASYCKGKFKNKQGLKFRYIE